MRVGRDFLWWPVVLAVTIACGQGPEFPSHRPFESDPRTARDLRPEDIEIFEAVIDAYAQAGEVISKGRRPPPPPPAPGAADPPPPERIEPLSSEEVQQMTSAAPVKMKPHTQLIFDAPQPRPGAWRNFEQDRLMQVSVPEKAVSDFAARNRTKVSLEPFNPRYVRVSRTADVKAYENLLVWSLPGYSASGDEAIIEVSVLAPPHGGGGQLIYLRRGPDGWRAVALQGTWIS